MKRSLTLALLLLGCGRTEPIPPVRANAVVFGEDGGLYCRSACPGMPPGVRTPLLTISGGTILHWPVCEGCLRLTVDPALHSETFVKNAGHDWDITLAGGLCFEDAVEEGPMPEDARQRVHVRFSAQGNSVTHRFEVATGVIRNAEVTISGSVNSVEMSFLLGRALGLDKSTDQVNSIMSWPNTQRNSPGDFDQTSLRVLYGPPSLWCQ